MINAERDASLAASFQPGTRTVAIVGAGLAGLVCAHLLKRAGLAVTVFDKGRYPGGRLASRSRDEHCFDYGAQYFTVHTTQFKEFLSPYMLSGALEKWNGRFGQAVNGTVVEESDRRERYVGMPFMRSIADSLAADIDCKMSHRVSKLRKSDAGSWSLSGNVENLEKPEQFVSNEYDFVVLNMPPPQAAQLHPSQEIKSVVMRPCVALLLTFDERVDLDWDGITLNDEVISWVARDSSKPGRPSGERWVFHASPEWSEKNFEINSDEIQRQMLERFASFFRVSLPSLTYSNLHKWRFARTMSPFGDECIYDSTASVVYCGDWCLGARVEGAYLSGSAAARTTIQALS